MQGEDINTTAATEWTRAEDKLFERALVRFPEGTPDRWHLVAAEVPGKTPWDALEHFEVRLHDLSRIEKGRVAVPSYSSSSFVPEWAEDSPIQVSSSGGSRVKGPEVERKKGVPWTEEEHRLFLLGLEKYGKGDWRSISRNAVVSRTPTQVASHAQKYYLRLNSEKKEKKRSSIHDITTPALSSTNPPAALSNHPVHPISNLGQPYLGQFREHGSSSSGGHPHFGYPM